MLNREKALNKARLAALAKHDEELELRGMLYAYQAVCDMKPGPRRVVASMVVVDVIKRLVKEYAKRYRRLVSLPDDKSVVNAATIFGNGG